MPLTTWIVQNTLAAACLALVVAAVCRWGRFSPALRHGLWLVVLIKLVTPPLVNIPVPLPQWVLAQVPSPLANPDAPVKRAAFDDSESVVRTSALPDDDFLSVAAPQDAGLLNDSNDTSSLMFANEDPAPNGGLEQLPDGPLSTNIPFDDAQQSITIAPESAATDRWTQAVNLARAWWNGTSPVAWLAWGWCAGTAVFVLIQIRRIINLRRLIAGGRPGAGELDALVAQIAGEMEVPPPPVRIVPQLPSPALCAWGRVSLLWPEGPFDRLSLAGRHAVVLHELAHLKRRDHWTGWVELLAGCGWWWNPIFWYVRHQLHENAELACDAWVVARLPDGRRAYAEALIDVAQGEPLMQLTGVVLGVGDGSRKLLERRLVMIMRGGVRYQIPVLGLAAIALVAVATLPQWSIAQSAQNALNAVANEAPVENFVGEIVANPGEFAPPAVDESRPTAAPSPFLFGSDSELAETQPAMTEPIERPAELAETLDAWEAPRDDVIALDYQDPAAGATFSFGVVTAPVAEKESAGFDDEASRLSRVEAQLGNLLNELRRLQKSLQPGEDAGKLKSMGVGTGVSGIIMGVPVDPTTIPTTRSHTKRIQQPMAVTRMPMKGATGIHFTNIFLENTAVETVIMTRTLYSLPKGHAEALAKSLAEQLNDDVEIKVKGDAIQVTASNEDQKAIAHLVHLILQKGRAPVSTNSAGYYLDPDRR